MRLEDLKPRSTVRGVLPDGVVTVVSVEWFGSEALELTYKTSDGAVANELLYRHDESTSGWKSLPQGDRGASTATGRFFDWYRKLSASASHTFSTLSLRCTPP